MRHQFAEVLQRGERLARTSPPQRDLVWHVEACVVGNLAALALLRARSQQLT